MLNIDLICEFSRNHCVSICAFLVPANLLTTLQTLILLFLMRPLSQIRLGAVFASFFALTLYFHVTTWLIIGVLTPVSFILFALGTICLIINLVAITYPRSCGQLLRSISKPIATRLNPKT